MLNKDKFVDNKNPKPISQGNSFEIATRLLTQKNIDTSNIDLGSRNNFVENSIIEKSLNDIFNEHIIEEYFLLKWLADYFCNTIDFETDNFRIREQVLKVIRVAFMHGRAGLYIDNSFDIPKIYAVYVDKEQYNKYGELEKCEISNINDYLNSKSREVESQKEVLEYEQCQGLSIFKWGIEGWGAWVLMWPFIKQQKKLLEMLYVSAFSYIKKFALNVTDPMSITNELNIFFNTKNPFIINSSLSNEEFRNRIKVLGLENSAMGSFEYINFYNEYIKIYFEIFGRRSNVDEKAERNLSSEIVASQEHFNAIQQDYKNQFKLFVDKFNANPLNEIDNFINFLNKLTTENENDN